MNRGGFTLMEILCTLLVLAAGMAAVVTAMLYASRLTREACASFTALATARSALPSASPFGGVDWTSDATSHAPATGSYAWHGRGMLNGYYVDRRETSSVRDAVCPGLRMADVTVEVYWSIDGQHLLTVRDRVLRSCQ